MAPATIPFTYRERVALAPPPDLTVSEWAKRFRVMSSMSSPRRGLWDSSFNPYVDEIMDARSDPKCRVAVPILPTQSGKSESMLNMIAWGADIPGDPQMVVLPTIATRRYFMLRRLLPMFQDCNRLLRLLTGLTRDEAIAELALQHSVIYTATGHSPSDLASKPCGVMFMDEIDRYPSIVSTKEGSSPVDLALERLRAWGANAFALLTSTPTTRQGLIWGHLESSDFRQYHVRCPSCRQWHVMKFEGIQPHGVRSWADVSPGEIRTRRLAAYHCSECGDMIPDEARPSMIAGGRWVPRDCKIRQDGSLNGATDASVRGWQAEALICLEESPSGMAADFMSARLKKSGLQRFVNLRRAWVWEERLENPDEERVLSLALPYDRGVVHEDAVLVTAGVDVQKHGFYFVVRAWGPGDRSYLVEHGYVESWTKLLNIVVRGRWKNSEGTEEWMVVRAMIDSSEGIRTDEIYRVARQYPDVIASAKGSRTIMGHTIKTVTLKRSKTDVGEGMPLTHINTSWAKDRIARDIGNGTFFCFAGVEMDYVRQICSEHKVRVTTKLGDKGVWEKKDGQRQNHYLDCEVLALAAAEKEGVAEIDDGPAEEFEQQQQKQSAAKPVSAHNDDDDWIHTPDGWLDDYINNW